MSPPRGTVFLERGSYRRRRVMDGARILPVAGFVLILLPVLWAFDNGANIAVEAVYLFVLWTLLIVVAAVLAGPLRNVLKREKFPPVAPVPTAAVSETDPDPEPDSDANTTLTGPEPGR